MKSPSIMPRVTDLRKLLPNIRTSFTYEQLPTSDSRAVSATPSPYSPFALKDGIKDTFRKQRWRSPSPRSNRIPYIRMSFSRFIVVVLTALICIALLGTGKYKRAKAASERAKKQQEQQQPQYPWMAFPRHVFPFPFQGNSVAVHSELTVSTE